jgi:hypothetical protein
MNKINHYFTKINFITKNRIPRNAYLYENRMFTDKVKHSIILGRKEKALGVQRKGLVLIKSSIYV